MSPEELETLKESMRLKGFLEAEAVRVLRGTNLVVDGKNRLKAARELSLKVAVVEVEIPEEELPYFVFSTAYHRRDIPTGIRAANAALCYSLLEQVAAERRRMGLKFYKQNLCQNITNESLGLMSPNYGGPDFRGIKSLLLNLYEKSGGRRKEFLRKFFKIAERDLKVALWLKRFLPEDFEALRRGEMTMAEAREIYRKAKPEMEARGALIEEWRDLEKRIPEFSRISVLLGYLDEETQRELLSTLKAGVSGDPGDQEGEKGFTPEDLMEIPQVKELVERAEALREEKRRLEERLRELSEAEKRMEDLKLEKAQLEKRLRELEEMRDRAEKEVVTVVDPEIEAEMERLRARLLELETEVEEARAEAESFSRERDRLEEERKKLEEANERLRQDLREARKHIAKLVKSIDPEKKRAKKRFIDKITRHYERKLEKLREKNRELKELLVEARTENARLKALLGGRALKVVPVKLVHMFMAMTGLLQNREFREMVVGLVKEAEVDAGELIDLVTDLQEAAAGLGVEILSAVRERREQLEAAVEADDFAKRKLSETLKHGLPPGAANGGKEKGGGNSAPSKRIKLKLRGTGNDRVSDRNPETEGSQVGGALEGRDLSSSQGEHKEAGAGAGTADSG